MTTGTVKWFNLRRGHGVVAPDGGGQDAFIHANAVSRAGILDLREGQKVTFDLITSQTTGKTTAENLKVVR